MMKVGEVKMKRKVNVIEDLDGKKTVFIHDILFKGKRAMKWDEVEKYLRQYVGDICTIDDKLIKRYPVLLKKIGDKYNYIFIDEYQDTSSYVLDIFYDAVKNRENVQIYLFGDRMQQIYRNYDGSFEGKLKEFDTSDRLEVNFRSIGKIVSILNNIYNDSSFEQQPTESNRGHLVVV